MRELDVNFTGPYSWPKYEAENGLPQLPKHGGLYLQTAEYKDGYIIYAAGLTKRYFVKRFYEHTRNYFKGEYTILDLEAIKKGQRQEIWHGWWWTPEKRKLFDVGAEFIHEAAHKQLCKFRLFVADVGVNEERILNRLEAAIMKSIYMQDSPICDIPDRGMHLSARWSSEKPIAAIITTSEKLYGLHSKLEI